MDATPTLTSLQPQLLGHFSGLMLNVVSPPKKKKRSETECFTCYWSKPRFRLPYCLIVHWPASWISKSWYLMFEVPLCSSGVEVMEGSGSPLPIGVFVNFSYCFLLGTKWFHLARNGWMLFFRRIYACKMKIDSF